MAIYDVLFLSIRGFTLFLFLGVLRREVSPEKVVREGGGAKPGKVQYVDVDLEKRTNS